MAVYVNRNKPDRITTMATFRTVAALRRHISDIRPGDVVWYRNDWRTVSGTDLKRQQDGTLTLFGSSFWGGHEPIAVADIRQTNPLGAHTMPAFATAEIPAPEGAEALARYSPRIGVL